MEIVVRLFLDQSNYTKAIVALILVGAIGAIDYLSGYEISIGVFYLFPVS